MDWADDNKLLDEYDVSIHKPGDGIPDRATPLHRMQSQSHGTRGSHHSKDGLTGSSRRVEPTRVCSERDYQFDELNGNLFHEHFPYSL